MDDAPASLSDAELETELLTLNAHLNAGEHRFLTLLAEVLARDLWAEDGVRSCAHWLSWKFGIGMTAGREKIRVAKALQDLPLVREAFRTGEISYSKVRAVARVAKPESDEYLLMICRNGTASHVERLVRAYRGVVTLEDQARARYARRCEWRYDEDRGVVIRARLPIEQGQLVVNALESCREALDREARQAVHDDVEPWPGHDSAEAVPAKIPASEEHEEWTVVTGHVMTDAEYEAAHGSTSGSDSAVSSDVEEETGRYDAEVMPPGGESRVCARMRRAIEDDYRRAGLRVGESRETRRADALVLMAETLLEHGPTARAAGERHEVVVHVDATLLAGTDDPADGRGRCTIGEGHAVTVETARRLGCDGALVGIVEGEQGEVLDVGRRSRAIPPAIRRALDARDGCCRFPGCNQTRWLDAHHIHHWAHGGETKLSNLVYFCSWHHSLVHEGGFTLSGDPSTPDGLTFRRPDGTVVPARPWLTDVVPGDLEALVRSNAADHGLDIDEHTGECRWDGLPMDMAMAVDGIVQSQGVMQRS